MVKDASRKDAQPKDAKRSSSRSSSRRRAQDASQAEPGITAQAKPNARAEKVRAPTSVSTDTPPNGRSHAQYPDPEPPPDRVWEDRAG